MSKLRFVVAVITFVSMGTLESSVHATSASHLNYLTFSAPFALPGVSLPAGTYVFETPLEHSSLDVVRVSSRDGKRVYLVAFTVPMLRPTPRSSEPQIVFGEAPAGTPTPVKIWYPAGQRIGHEFIY
jgi:hypothetical protein